MRNITQISWLKGYMESMYPCWRLAFVLVFMVWVPLSVKANEAIPEATTLATPTVNVTATMTALQEDQYSTSA